MSICQHIKKPMPFRFFLQWHITAKCDQHCKHCYMYDSPTYDSEIKNELSYKNCIKVIDDLYKTTNAWKIPGSIIFTGGDPLLRKDFFDILKYANSKKFFIVILGNPNHLDYETAVKLKENGVKSYQISIDGMEKTHDNLRGKKGMFKECKRAIKVLNKVGLRSVVMFTLSKTNADEILDVMRFSAENKVETFSFTRLVPMGNGKQMMDQMLKPKEYRKLLLKIGKEAERLRKKGYKTRFDEKDHLWILLKHELGLINPPKNKELIFGGCSVGINGLAVLADGNVLACRRMPIVVGKIPEQKIRDIFIESEELNKLRDYKKMEKCGKCKLMQICRGCPAVAHGANGSYFSKDPQCWK